MFVTPVPRCPQPCPSPVWPGQIVGIRYMFVCQGWERPSSLGCSKLFLSLLANQEVAREKKPLG